MLIESKDNQRFKNWSKLKLKKYRDETNQFLVYGQKMVDLAKKYNCLVDVITTNPQIEGILITEKLMSELNQTETMFDVMGVCKKKVNPIESNKILVLDDVQNPDNVGALLRSALAFGFKHVVVSNKSADIYNEKTIRASQGAIFEVYVERLNLVRFITDIKQNGYQVFGADAHASENSPSNEKFVLVLGNEGNGLSEEVKTLSDGFLNIKTQSVESLNVVVAGSILMYEWSKL